ncbi:MAG: protein kinase [Lentisphaerae bacterium]|jgi:serine/threonine protein kinase|nr:protein kinase [Lentisphaerota bacterium]
MAMLMGIYEVGELIGCGAVADVVRVTDTRTGESFAVKLFRDGGPAELAQFYREGSVRFGNHPNLIQTHLCQQDGDCHIMVQDYVDGCTLEELVQRNGGLGLIGAVEVLYQALVGIENVHAHGLIHSDLKASNILLEESGCVRICDFGAAQEAQELLGGLKHLWGTPGYIPPEAILDGWADTRADIFSLGSVFHYAATGAEAFSGGTDAERNEAACCTDPCPLELLVPDISVPLSSTIRKALAKDPEDRFGSATEFRWQLSQTPECQQFLHQFPDWNPAVPPPPLLHADPGSPCIARLKCMRIVRNGQICVSNEPFTVLEIGPHGKLLTRDQLMDDHVSAVHAWLWGCWGRLWIEDVGSTNGTHVNGQPIRGRCELRPNDQVWVGDVAIEWEPASPEPLARSPLPVPQVDHHPSVPTLDDPIVKGYRPTRLTTLEMLRMRLRMFARRLRWMADCIFNTRGAP